MSINFRTLRDIVDLITCEVFCPLVQGLRSVTDPKITVSHRLGTKRVDDSRTKRRRIALTAV